MTSFFENESVLPSAICADAGRLHVLRWSRRGNAPVESFFSTRKVELVHGRDYETRQQARAEPFAFIEGWYNRQRRHSSLGYVSPVDDEVLRDAQNLPCSARGRSEGA